MRVKELCGVIEKEAYVSVYHENEFLKGEYPCDFLDCDLIVKRISVIACEVILIET